MLRNILISANILLIILVLSLKSIEIKLITLYSVLISGAIYIIYSIIIDKIRYNSEKHLSDYNQQNEKKIMNCKVVHLLEKKEKEKLNIYQGYCYY